MVYALRNRKKSVSEILFDTLNTVFLILFSFTIIYPFINLIALSFNDGIDAISGGIYFFPRKFSLQSYQMILSNPHLWRGFGMSVLRVLVGTGVTVLMSALLAYVVSQRSFSGRKFMRILFLVTMYFGGGMIPTYLVFLKLGLNETFTVYWLPSMVGVYYMLIISSYIQDLPETIFESVRVDGGDDFRIFFQFTLPMCMPVLACVALFVAVDHWNAWFDVMVYNSSGKFDTIQVYLRRILLESEALQQTSSTQEAYNRYRDVTPATLRAATTIVVTLPILFVYPFLQKYFVGGITLGSVKG